MTLRLRELILRFRATYLGVAAAAGVLLMDIPAIFFGTGPEAPILHAAPFAGIGLLEAHGLALIISILLWRAPSTRLHVTVALLEFAAAVAGARTINAGIHTIGTTSARILRCVPTPAPIRSLGSCS